MKKKYKIISSILACIIIIAAVIYTALPDLSPAAKASHDEWMKCKGKKAVYGTNFEVNWTIKLKQLNTFGGPAGETYLYNNKDYPVYVVWDPQSEYRNSRTPFIGYGDTIRIRGTCEGFHEQKQSVFVEIDEMKVLKKGWLRFLSKL